MESISWSWRSIWANFTRKRSLWWILRKKWRRMLRKCLLRNGSKGLCMGGKRCWGWWRTREWRRMSSTVKHATKRSQTKPCYKVIKVVKSIWKQRRSWNPKNSPNRDLMVRSWRWSPTLKHGCWNLPVLWKTRSSRRKTKFVRSKAQIMRSSLPIKERTKLLLRPERLTTRIWKHLWSTNKTYSSKTTATTTRIDWTTTPKTYQLVGMESLFHFGSTSCMVWVKSTNVRSVEVPATGAKKHLRSISNNGDMLMAWSVWEFRTPYISTRSQTSSKLFCCTRRFWARITPTPSNQTTKKNSKTKMATSCRGKFTSI